jgi:IS605 OrfB family transposase
METTRTVVCKLAPTSEQVSDIDATLKAFAAGCDFAADAARRIGSTNKVKVQHEAYREIRDRFGLSANLAIRAIARACAALKVPEKMHSTFAPTSIDYDARIFSFIEWNWTFGLTLLSGRVKIATVLGDRQRSLLKGRHPTAAVLVKRRDGGYYLHVQLTDEAPEPIETEGTLGVDLGRRRVAVDSDERIYEAEEVNRVRKHYPKVRRSAQSKGTRGSKRFLKRLSGREKRHQRAINHKISRQIVDKARETGRTIILEDLTGIRRRTKVRKEHRYAQQSWSFFQLRSFIAYKAEDAGIPVVFIDPAYTSQTCHICGERGHRDGLVFSCPNHGDLDADINAAKFIAVAGVQVTAPGNAGGAGRMGSNAPSECKATGLQPE